MFFNVNIDVTRSDGYTYINASVSSYGVHVYFPEGKSGKVADKLRSIADDLD